MRLLLEIGYIVEESLFSYSPQIVFLVSGAILSLGIIVMLYLFMRLIEGRRWLLDKDG
jgi:membrane protein YdbS with pleckstrin-like domain